MRWRGGVSHLGGLTPSTCIAMAKGLGCGALEKTAGKHKRKPKSGHLTARPYTAPSPQRVVHTALSPKVPSPSGGRRRSRRERRTRKAAPVGWLLTETASNAPECFVGIGSGDLLLFLAHTLRPANLDRQTTTACGVGNRINDMPD